ncbi:MAG: HlyD family type I secretion periplasmic adaptor subunit [Pseudomonadota bacterium]
MQKNEPKKPATDAYYLRLGYSVIAIVFGGLIFWSVVAPIDGAVAAGGQIVVEGNRKAVQHLEGGTVAELMVREGKQVRKDDILVRLDDTVQKANLSLVDGQLAELYARRARLAAERDGLDAITAPDGVASVLATPLFGEKLRGQRNLFEARASTIRTQISLLEERVVQQRERISGLRVQIRSLNSQIAIITKEIDSLRDLLADGLVTRNRFNELERESERLAGERGALTAGIAEAQSVISEARLEIERLSETRREEAITELREVEGSISELEERRIAAADAYERTLIRAPEAGRVLGLSVHTVGGVIAPGAPLMEIVPEATSLQVSAKIAPQDVDKVQSGQSTLVRFSAFGSRRTPETQGNVKTISADSIVDEITGAPYYLVIIDLPPSEQLQDILRGNLLLPGMPVETFIKTGKRPAISYLLKPLLDSFARSMRED